MVVDFSVNAAKCEVALGTEQYRLRTFGPQWVFAFIIAGVVFSATIPLFLGLKMSKDINGRHGEVGFMADLEGRPLLDDE